MATSIRSFVALCLVHHSVILELNLPSFRMAQAKQSKRRGGKDAEAAAEETGGAGEGA